LAGLESVGGLAFTPYWNGVLDFENSPLRDYPWNLSPKGVMDFWNSLLDQFRIRGAIEFPSFVSPTDEFFAPRNRNVFIREAGAEVIRNGMVLGWSPAKGPNGRSDLFTRLLGKRDIQDPKLVEEVLAGTWNDIRALAEETNIVKLYSGREVPIAYQVNTKGWQITRESDWGMCDRCGTITSRPHLGICPTYRCRGDIELIRPEESLRENHYRRLYHHDKLLTMRVEEHTAQLSSRAASEMQKLFDKGIVNVLSCSTTFEMGVDVGDLETVLLRNVPPEPANYIQRAGRAGRGTSNTGFTLTYAQRRSHDATFYADPPRMITGEIRPPSITLANDKIVLRHLYALALAWYFRKHSATFQDFRGLDKIMPADEPYKVIKDLYEELIKEPKDLLDAIETVIPKDMQGKLGVPQWEWVQAFASPNADHSSILYTAISLLQADLEYIDEVRVERIKTRRSIDHLERLRRTLLDKNVISFLSSKNALPKYGFPVDVVSLDIISHDQRAVRLELERDLRIAVGEYAPGSEVVAGGYVWKSYALKKPPGKDWEERHYAICEQCQSYTELLKIEDGGSTVTCVGCGSELKREKSYVIPSYGFLTKAEQKLVRPRQTRPQRAYVSRVYFSHFDEPTPFSREKSGYTDLHGGRFQWSSSSLGHLVVLNTGPGDAGYRICRACGFAVPSIDRNALKESHIRPFGGDCNNRRFINTHLGHSFQTDVLELSFPLPNYSRDFWLSMTYALLEGAANALGIARSDIDGCVYVAGGTPSRPSIILFDDVPGGAGHVKRLATEKEILAMLKATISKVKYCECGEETSCYGCLRNYRNQWCHHELRRGPVASYLEMLVGVGQ
ncbi:MAG: DUF1998 domain-containing protein, partial [Firmicutes bacterium]|nr:DUF1998 domain-containing protein [Bacillota bacterium]